MNAPVDKSQLHALQTVSLDDKYTQGDGHAFMTGTQAMVRLPMLQRQRDLAAGHNTAGYISGYRGSPVGGFDQTLHAARKHLDTHHIKFQPGVNEDLAATAIWGTQQANLFPGAKYDGVFGMWYGKGPGVDRCGDVFKHVNMAGTSPLGGVLALAGDDHGAKSSTTAHQSEQILAACSLPVMYPASVQDMLDFGLHGFALSRFASVWVGIKCVTDIIESGAVVDLSPERVKPIIPPDATLPADGLAIRLPDHNFIAEENRLLNYKLPAVKAYVRANGLNKSIWRGSSDTIGIISAGKAYADLRQALADLGIDEARANALGIRLFKVAVTWPLEETGIATFAEGLSEIVVIEEKRPHLESQIKEILYGISQARVTAKTTEGVGLHGELTPAIIAKVVAARFAKLLATTDAERIKTRLLWLDAKENALTKSGLLAVRQPYFCSGCPHNTSTKVPEGSRALAGIGCHYMAQWMDRSTATFTHMGAEGMTWVGAAPFSTEDHVFINLGDGTYFHSGLLAIRGAVAGKVNATYKILFNDAVAMTGGQRHDGPLNPAMISLQLHGEGVKPIFVVTDEPEKYPSSTEWAPGVTVRHRDELDAVQKELREVKGISALIYDQTCASEKRRRRKRNEFPDPPKRAFINDAVCEGCGDCSAQSNCISVEPLETEFGRKRQINQSSCNKDYSCVKGFCPSFVTVEGAQLKKPKKAAQSASSADVPPTPAPMALLGAAALKDSPWNILVTGVGGTGVITIGQIVAMAAHLEGMGCQVLDMSGLAQKGGLVMSHLQLAANPAQLHATRIGTAAADVVLGCELIVTAGKEPLAKVGEGRTHMIVNATSSPTAVFIKNPNYSAPDAALQAQLSEAAGTKDGKALAEFVDANRIATALMGDAIATNMFMLGYAWQKGLVPLSEAALIRAVELNGVSIDFNKKSFAWGRAAAHDLAQVTRIASPAQVIPISSLKREAVNVDELIEKRVSFLTAYQDAAYASNYKAFVEEIRGAEAPLGSTKLTEAVARYLAKLMAYKDEYEVARLYTDPAYMAKLESRFESEDGGKLKLRFYLAPPLFAKKNAQGELIKKPYGAWVFSVFKVLAKLKSLRGGALDVFGYTTERKGERALIGHYQATVKSLLSALNAGNHALAIEIASLPEEIRGFGHVKERHLIAAKAKEAKLLEAYRGSQVVALSKAA